MVWVLQAHLAYDMTRKFYKGEVKSDNKRYGGATDDLKLRVKQLAAARGMTSEQAEQKVQQRDLKQQTAQSLISEEWRAPWPQTPVEIGKIRFNAKMTHGNCGEMACVAMYIGTCFGVPPNQMVLATARNPTATKGLFGRTHMTFGHSWALFGPPEDGWAIDPWAGVLCDQKDYPNELRAKLNKWHAMGKRIGVTWSDGTSSWTNANDEAILSLLAETAKMDYLLGSEGRVLGKR